MEFLGSVEIKIADPKLNQQNRLIMKKDPLHQCHNQELNESRKQTFSFFSNATGSHVYMTTQTQYAIKMVKCCGLYSFPSLR